MADNDDSPPPRDPVKHILTTVEERGRPLGQKYKVKKRPVHPRKKRGPLDPKHGGWRGQPGSLEALELHRGRTQFGRQRRCEKEGCGAVAVRNVQFCRHHGGQHELNIRRRMDPDYKPKRITLFRRELKAALARGDLPPELIQQPAFLLVLRVALSRVDVIDGDYMTAVNIWRHANGLLHEFMAAWVVLKDTGDAGPWVRCAMKAKTAGF